MHPRLRHPACLWLLTAQVACTPPAVVPPSSDVVLSWNQRVLAFADAEDGFFTLKGVRSAALMHLAMHDAVNAIDARYSPFIARSMSQVAAKDADPIAAAARAAHDVVSAQYPGRADSARAELARWRTGVDREPSWLAGEEIGRQTAAAILAARANDVWNAEPTYQWHPMGPGVYAEFAEHSGTPTGFIFGAGWARATPFMLDSASQFRVPPPPEIGSEDYTRAFNEVKDVGAAHSGSRTPDQTHLARWWKPFAEISQNALSRELVRADGLALGEAARLFALLNMSIHDGYLAVFESKFHYNHWRPYTAIRWAAHDGNPDTMADPEWDNTHGHTYAFPSYPSAHGTVCAAAMTVLADVFGDDRPFTMRTPAVDSAGPGSGLMTMEPATRSFESFSEAARECSLSRVYLGIHFRYDSERGTELGARIGAFGLDNMLTPIEQGRSARASAAERHAP